MRATVMLSDAIDEYLASRRSQGYSTSTLRTSRGVLVRFLETTGNIRVASVTPRHTDGFFQARSAQGLVPGTLNLYATHLSLFFKFCVQRRYLSALDDPAAHRRKYRAPERLRLRVSVANFPHLLDSAPNPRDRMVVALGLYLLLRQSEMRTIRVQDVLLNDSEVRVTVHKTGLVDAMPVSTELDAELRRWLTHYTEAIGRPLEPDDYLLPGVDVRLTDNRGNYARTYRPKAAYRLVHESAKRAMLRAGAITADDKMEGVHTLRRSAARARYDVLVSLGHDGAIKQVGALLHHKTTAMTEKYIGLELDRVTRDKTIKGQAMYPVGDNVVQLGVRERAV